MELISNSGDGIKRVIKSTPKIAVKFGMLATVAFGLSGCLLTSPFWSQEYDNRNDPIDLQAWTTNPGTPVRFECAKATHYGLHPYGGTPVWNHISNASPTGQGSYDSTGFQIHSASKSEVLPSSCWHYDGASSQWLTAIRAKQGGTTYKGFNTDGLACLGEEIGQTRRWLGWLGKGCTLTYSNSDNEIPYTRIRAAN